MLLENRYVLDDGRVRSISVLRSTQTAETVECFVNESAGSVGVIATHGAPSCLPWTHFTQSKPELTVYSRTEGLRAVGNVMGNRK